jgi:hypothetical protein
VASGRLPVIIGKQALSKVPLDRSRPVEVIKGFNRNEKPSKYYPNDKGFITIEIKELERVEIHLFDSTLNVEPRTVNLSSLPIGSTLDIKRGVFYWLPGPGFVGDYTFDFVLGLKEGLLNKIKRIRVKIKILPK